MKLWIKRQRNRQLFFLIFGCFLGILGISTSNMKNNINKESSIMKTEEIKNLFAYVLAEKEVAFQYLGYSGVIIRTIDGAVIIDPADKIGSGDLKFLSPGTVNLILYTHDHYDHFHQATAFALFKATDAPILAEATVINRLRRDIPADKLFVASPDNPFHQGNITVRAIRGSHVGPIMLYHLAFGNLKIFHGADSDYIPLSGFSADVAFLPTGDPSPTASPRAAFQMANDLKPKIIVAIHGSSSQHKELGKLVQEKMPGVKIIFPAPYSLNREKID